MKNNITLKQIGIIMWAVGFGGSITVIIGNPWFPVVISFIGIAIVVKCLINERKKVLISKKLEVIKNYNLRKREDSDFPKQHPYPHTFRKGKQLSEETIKQLLKRKNNE